MWEGGNGTSLNSENRSDFEAISIPSYGATRHGNAIRVLSFYASTFHHLYEKLFAFRMKRPHNHWFETPSLNNYHVGSFSRVDTIRHPTLHAVLDRFDMQG